MRTSRPKWPWMAKTPIRQGPEGLGKAGHYQAGHPQVENLRPLLRARPGGPEPPHTQGPEGLGLTSKAEMAMDGISAV